MARVTFTKDNFLAVKILPPTWYKLLVKSYEDQAAKTDGSDLYIFTLVVEEGPMKGVPIRLQGSEKFFSAEFMEFMEVMGAKPGEPVEMEKFVGKKIEGFVQKGEYKGKPQNQFVGFRTPGKEEGK